MGSLTTKIHSSDKKDPAEDWSNQFRERETNVIYRWVVGGELIKLYEKDGEEGILRFADDKIRGFLYDEGEKGSRTITENEFLKWRKTTTGNFEDPSRESPHYYDQKALWKINKRGVDGENLVHLLLNRDQPVCHEIARILLKKFPGLANDICLNDDYFGQSSLHLAIVQHDYETVQLLLECGVDVNIRSTGTFFLPKKGKNAGKNADYTGWAYYGEFPLAFAACFADKDIYDLLIEAGANPNSRDYFGNTILHMCVISNSISMYSYAVRHWASPADPNILNEAGYTPLTLATKLGRKEIFHQMMELSKIEFWRFADMTCSAYPLTTLDTIRTDGSTNYDSVLMTVVKGSTPEHLDMIENEVIQRLIDDKWKAFAKSVLYFRMGLTFLHLVFMCVATWLRSTSLTRIYLQEVRGDNKSIRAQEWIRLMSEIVTLLLTLNFFVLQIRDLRVQGLSSYTRNMSTTPAKLIYAIGNFMLLLCVPCRLLFFLQVEEALIALAIPASFIYCLFFARTFKLTGPFVQMIYSMVAGDLAKFTLISAIFVTPFAFVMYFLGKDIPAKQKLLSNNTFHCSLDGNYSVFTFESRIETAITLIRASMKSYDYEELACSNYAIFTKIIFVIYMLIMPTMMISIIIAMMGNTYKSVIAKAEKAWRRQFALIIMNLERSLNEETLQQHMNNYSIKLQEGNNKKEENNIRGLLVVRKTNKTRTSARLNATRNWRRISRKVIRVIEFVGIPQAVAMMHGFENVENVLHELEKKKAEHEAQEYEEVCSFQEKTAEILQLVFLIS